MLGTDRVYGALALVTAVAAAAAAVASCGGSSDTAGTGGAGGQGAATSASSSSNSSSASSGGSGGAMPCPPKEATTLALTKLEFGDGNSGEWKKFGFNIDGLVSTGASQDVCQPASGGTPVMSDPDGDNGIDNSFGKNLLPLIISEYPAWPSDVNASIQAGNFNALLKLYCLPPTGDVPVLTTKLFGGTTLGTPPKFDGTDKWPVAPELLADPMDPESSTIAFEKSSVKGNKFDSAENQNFILTVPMKSKSRSTSVKLNLHAAHVTMKLSADRKSATGGMIGGVLDTEAFVTEVKKIAWVFGVCDDSLYDALILQVRQSSDIMKDGTQNPNKTCNGISIGIGFEMKEVLIGDVGPAAEVGMTCP